jgi:hypothetical protein
MGPGLYTLKIVANSRDQCASLEVIIAEAGPLEGGILAGMKRNQSGSTSGGLEINYRDGNSVKR